MKPAADGSNVAGTVYIPNTSVLTVSMGNVTFNNYVNGQLIGNSTIDNLVLKPGNNTVPMHGVTNQSAVLDLIASTYKNGVLPIDIVGNSSVYNGLHLPYYEKALKSNTQHVELNITAALLGL